MRRALLVHLDAGVGGAAKAAVQDATLLADAGREVAFLSSGGPEECRLRQYGIPLFRFPPRSEQRGRSLRLLLTTYPHVYRAVRSSLSAWPADAVVVHAYQLGLPVAIAARQSGATHLAVLHAAPRQRLGFLAMGMPHRIAATSSMVRQSLGGTWLADRADVIENAVSLHPVSVEEIREARRAWDLPSDCPLVACVSLLIPLKGHVELLSAWSEICTETEGVLVLAGDGPLRRDLVAFCETRGISNRVRFIGYVDVAPLYALASVVVLPSYREGLPLTVLEAAAASKPIVATPVGGVPDVVQDEQTGLLVPVGDSTALATALRRLLQDAPLRQRLGAAAHAEYQARFTLSNRARVLSAWLETWSTS